MAAFPLTDVDLYADGLDLSCFSNQATVSAEAVELDATTFCSAGWTTLAAGLKSLTFTTAGPQDLAASTAATTSTIDEVLALTIGNAYTLSAVPAGGTEGNVGYFTSATFLGYTPLEGSVGDLASQTATWKGRTPLVRGTLTSLATVTASGNGTGFQIGAVSATQRVWAAVHFLTAGGTTPSITARIESDNNAGFTTPTTRITFTAATVKGGQFSSLIGPFTDDYWRCAWTVSGTTPSFQVRALIGIV